jgi:hypothetical protein
MWSTRPPRQNGPSVQAAHARHLVRAFACLARSPVFDDAPQQCGDDDFVVE